MDYNKKIILYELNNNNNFLKIKIKNNKIKTKNKKIEKYFYDIIQKKKITIKKIKFYISKYNFNLAENNEYLETIKNLNIDFLPIYKYKTSFLDYIDFYKKEFRNEIRLYETKKFINRKYIFNDEKQCLETIKWSITNYKFDTFNQLIYHAGDYSDIERYGFLYIRSIFDKIKIKKIDNNVFNESKIEIWDKFKTDFESIKNTMFYMFNKMKKGILVAIKNNKLEVFLPFSNINYTNDFYEELYFDEKDKRNLLAYKKNPNEKLSNILKNTTKYYLQKYNLSLKNIILDRTKWVANNCFFKYEKGEGDKDIVIFEDFFYNLCKNRKLSDCIFFLNLRDNPMIRKDGKDSYNQITNKDLQSKYKFNNYAPILSVGPSIDTADIPLITADDCLRILKNIYPDSCKNNYRNEVDIIPWNKKIDKAIFRGSATGCRIDLQNVRIKASYLSNKYPEYLDAGIVSYNKKLKKNLGRELQVIKPDIQKKNFITLQEKCNYKYILNLDGHVSAFRLGHEMSLKCVVLIPKSKFYLWFSHKLVEYEHFIPISENLDDLIEKIKWCKNNDSKCEEIANNAYKFYLKYLTKDGLFDYMQYVLSKISLTSLNLKKYDKNIAIITLYRNDINNTRLEQKRKFMYFMNKILHQICNYKIIVVEQSKDYKFNIGKLKNIGFEIINKLNINFDNYVFTDIDTIPDSNLIEYLFRPTDSLNALAKYGTRYTDIDIKVKKPFVGALVTCTKDVFQLLNGFPNNFYGWEGEDTNLLLRLYAVNKPLYIPKSGSIIDLEEVNNISKTIVDKLSELKKENNRESHVYEKNMNYANYKSNGLSNLTYSILYENIQNDNIHVIVDLKYNDDIIKFKNDYIFNNTKISKDVYKYFINKKIFSIKIINF